MVDVVDFVVVGAASVGVEKVFRTTVEGRKQKGTREVRRQFVCTLR